jgi:hypothetical protein
MEIHDYRNHPEEDPDRKPSKEIITSKTSVDLSDLARIPISNNTANSQPPIIDDKVNTEPSRNYTVEELNLKPLIFDGKTVWLNYNGDTNRIINLTIDQDIEEIENGIEGKEYKKLTFPVWNVKGLIENSNYSIKENSKTQPQEAAEILRENEAGIIERSKNTIQNCIAGNFRGTIRPKIMTLMDGKNTKRLLPEAPPELSFYIIERNNKKCYMGKSTDYFSSDGTNPEGLKCKIDIIDPNTITAFSPIINILNSALSNRCIFYAYR